MRRTILSLFAALSLAACGTVPSGRAAVPGMVSAADPRAVAAGVEILRAGGTAADAALATMIALTVVEPQSSGIGGGGFLVYSDTGGSPLNYDGRETAPMAATPTWFFRNGQPMNGREAVPGGKSVGVPGNIRLAGEAHDDFGKLPWARLFDPAIRLARDGFVMTGRLNRSLGQNKTTGALSPEARAIFYGADGNPLPVGTTVRNPRLAAFLEQLAKLGPDSFYVGPNASAIVNTVNSAPLNPSQMTTSDIAAYKVHKWKSLCGVYRGHQICGMGPPSSGQTTMFAILKQLERFDLAALGPQSSTSWHLIAESTRLAFTDRDKYIADPAYVAVPANGLIDPGYLAQRSGLIAPDRTLPTVEAGVPRGAPIVTAGVQPVEAGTSHFVAVDRRGSVASYTSTIEAGFGSGLMVNGYYLNNELTDFSIVPTKDGLPVANRVEGGKKPRSSMAPTIVYGPDGRVRLAVGAAGGATIIAQVAKAIIGVIDWKLSARDAIALPTVFAPGDTLYVERGTNLEAMIPALRALGHKVEARPPGFKANAIEWIGGRWIGAADPRSEGTAVSE